MIISPPFVLPLQSKETDDQFLDRMMSAANAGDGGFPVSFEMNWHGGVHLTAPLGGSTPVRAIADGTVIFVRPPTPQSNDKNHPLNYRGKWTDDGCIVIRHETDIGINIASRQPTSVTFFSIYQHLMAISKTIRKDQPIFRKDELGRAGRIYGDTNKIHFEIICDDNNIKNLTGRKDEFLAVDHGGRTDVIFGAIWFLLLVKTPFFASKPQAKKPLPQVVFTNDEAFFISMTFRRGDAVFKTHHIDGRPLGNEVVAQKYEYNLFKNATRLYPKSPSAGYDLLRFGRVLGPDALDPGDAPNWQEVALPGGTGWVNLNGPKVRKFSDADFPHWDNWWVLVDGSASADSRCREVRVIELLDVDRDLIVKPQEAQQSLNKPDVQRRLFRKICKFPTEWDATTIDRRFGWLKTDPRTKMSAADFARFKAHVSALCFWQQAQPGIDGNHWHVHPKQFIQQFRKCGWLSDREFAQCIPKEQLHLKGTIFSTEKVATWSTAFGRSSTWSARINVAARKYLISTNPQRLTHFLAQVLEESGFLQFVKEIGGEKQSYAPYFGRGLIQLTHEENYKAYGNYRHFATSPRVDPKFASLGWNPDTLIATDQALFNAANCADSAGFFWVSRTKDGDNGLVLSDHGINVDDVFSISQLVNGRFSEEKINGLDVRIENVIYLKYILLDFIRTASTERVQFQWRQKSRKAKSERFLRTTHTIDVPLDHQRP